VPQVFLDWLRPGGRLFIIHGQSPAQEAVCLTRSAQGFDTESLFETDIPYLVGAQPVDRFSL
jgi:protein-L-isoaspartate(D-aspartate) O-methyltransferase